MAWGGVRIWVFVGVMTLVWAACGGVSLEERFKGGGEGERGVSVVVRVTTNTTLEQVVSEIELFGEYGAGGVLIKVPWGHGDIWPLLQAGARRCRELGLEMGVCNLVDMSEPVEVARELVWSWCDYEGGEIKSDMVPHVYGPAEGYEEVGCLAVPLGRSAQVSQVVDVRRGVVPGDGLWRVVWLGSVAVEPRQPDPFERGEVTRYINRTLMGLQERLNREYGTTLLWYQFAGFRSSGMPWYTGLGGVYQRRSGLGVQGSLPAVAGVELDGGVSRVVRRNMAEVISEVWREGYAGVIGELVQEAGLEAGMAVSAAPVAPEDVAYFFRRPVLRVAGSEGEHQVNRRAAGCGRVVERRLSIGRLDLGGLVELEGRELAPFMAQPEAASLFGDGAQRLLVDGVGGGSSVEREEAVALCRYARRCQLMLNSGVGVADMLVFAAELPAALEGYSVDYVNYELLSAALVRGREITFGSERSYGALVVDEGVLGERGWRELLQRLVKRGARVWVSGGGEGVLPQGIGRFMRGAGGVGVPDFEWRGDSPGMRLSFIHRRLERHEVYLLVNNSGESGTIIGTFRDTLKGVAERWEPHSGTISILHERSRRVDGRLDVRLYLEPYEAVFVVFM